ncbi:UDP-glucose/GDP-mannose dehydrogenase family protein, partial [Patescibacteria group bacterium]|nr:UDP-glucose/GDP-mannose dehydrogenase family protein [Patescibacteria group bacterium]
MKITVIGTGYVGLIQGVCLAELGNTVSCVDIDTDKIESLRNGRSPIYEPGLEKLIRKNIKAGRLFFTPSLAEAMTGCSVVFIAVGTPASPDGSADLRQIEQAATEIAQHISQPIIIAIKSTVPPGTCRKVRETVATRYAGDFAVLANPEFLREGSAVADFLKPDRIVIGGSEPAASQLAELYQPLKAPVLITSAETAEVIKYASNSFLATQISFINSIAHLCEKVGADVTEVAEGMKLDPRIGRRALLGAGLGYGGSCLPKDVNALIHTTRQHGIDFPVLEAVQHTNSHQYARFLEKVLATIGPEIKGKIVTL